MRIAGKDVYLGKHGSKEAAERYAEIVAAGPGVEPPPKKTPLTVAEACQRYLDHATVHYRKPSGENTSEVEYVERAISVLIAVSPATRAEEFRGRALKEARKEMIRRGWCRNNTNHHVNVVKRMWRWLLGEELVSAECVGSLVAVEALKRGRTAARETAKIKPAVMAHVEACLPYLSPHLRAAVRVQLLTACRPGEALSLDPAEVEMSGPVWLWRPAAHKTEYADKDRLIPIGPKAQEVLCPLLEAHPGGVLFSPKRSEALRRELVRQGSPTPRKTCLSGQYAKGGVYSVEAFHKALSRACDKAGVPRFAPNRLRHTAGTLIAAEFGPLVAQTLLGHSNLRTTEIYAERSLAPAIEAIAKVG